MEKQPKNFKFRNPLDHFQYSIPKGMDPFKAVSIFQRYEYLIQNAERMRIVAIYHEHLLKPSSKENNETIVRQRQFEIMRLDIADRTLDVQCYRGATETVKKFMDYIITYLD